MANAQPAAIIVAPGPYVHGRYDNAVAWTLVTAKDIFVRDLVIRNVNHRFFNHVSLESINCVDTYAKIRRMRHTSWSKEQRITYALAEMIAPFMPNDRILDTAAASIKIISDVNHMFPLTVGIQRMTVAAFNALAAEIHSEDGQFPDHATNPICDITALATAPAITTLNQAVAVIRIISRLGYPANKQLSNSLSLYVVLIISIIKMGNVTQRFIDKITTGISDELGVDLDYLEPDIIRTIWNNIGGFINETNMDRLTNDWENWIPDAALRLKLTIRQSAGEGLTALSTIKLALTTAVGFPWDEVNDLLPDEVGKVVLAFQTVGLNTFYGYKKDLGVVKSTNYPSFAYVAKELMIRAFGDKNLRSYKGWKAPSKKVQLDILIDAYVNAPPPAGGASAVAVAALATLRNASVAATGLA